MANNDNARTIHTNLYSDKAEIILSAFCKILGDFWGGTRMRRAAAAIQLDRGPDAEVVLIYNRPRYSSTLWDKHPTDAESRDWIAWMIKNIIGREVENANRYAEKDVVKAEFKKLWKRDCKAESKVFATFAGESIIIKELYAIYDALKNRPNMERKYTKKLLADVIGTQRDPVQTEMELARREEVARIETEYRAKIHDANPDNWNSEAHKRLQKIYEEMKNAERQKMKALEDEMHQKIAEVNESLRAAMMMGIIAA